MEARGSTTGKTNLQLFSWQQNGARGKLFPVPDKRRNQEPPIRLTKESREIAVRVAAALENKLTYVQIVDIAVGALGEYFDHYGGRLLLPLRFQESFRVNVMPLPGETMTLRMPPRAQQESGSEVERDRTRRPVRKLVRKG